MFMANLLLIVYAHCQVVAMAAEMIMAMAAMANTIAPNSVMITCRVSSVCSLISAARS